MLSYPNEQHEIPVPAAIFATIAAMIRGIIGRAEKKQGGGR